MKKLLYFSMIFFLLGVRSVSAEPTFGDLAVLLAKGYFKKDLSQSASLEECVGFLNRNGVCFSLFDLMDPDARVTREDFARVVGQSTLLFLGEADLAGGCIEKPIGVKCWVDYCLLNDVDLDVLWNGFVERTETESLPEVRKFFK